ncbi:MAG TPA: phosphoribosylformylglycinamidine synthase, partial [Chitinispirillaceae bacterium]|nr:phosphoribosylformylglycinamidine synthase [Chitinispirillaceae bacterium]
MGVRRVFVEKKAGFDVFAQGLLHDFKNNLRLNALKSVRVLNRYDVEGITDQQYRDARDVVFAELPVDTVYEEAVPLKSSESLFAIEYLPGQYDQRADSAAQCIQLLTHGNRPAVAAAQVIVLDGISDSTTIGKIKKYYINPVDSREASLDKPETLIMEIVSPPAVAVLSGFVAMKPEELENMRCSLGLAMRQEDLQFCQSYFRDTEKHDPTITEIRMLDTYWSDHCRHTTFLTALTNVSIKDGAFAAPIAKAYDQYQKVSSTFRKPGRSLCLMEMATLGMKQLRKSGQLDNLDESEEINACSIVVPVEIDGRKEEWLIMFKNETHNHPTEIEPFGGAATCLGGAIRDPLSGRSYVYHAMRVTGSGDPRMSIESTLPGKLPQRKISTLAAHGYSSYGNQIGLATGLVSEIYHEGYVAKRMEIGAVVGAAPKADVVRGVPQPGDLILLIGGRTGRDGCGGATGSSKEHTEESIAKCGAEVQKGNPPVERKLQRLFRNREVTTMIKRCNDFGAGGVSVAIGELAEGLEIDLDAVPKKYDGLDGTELAISESQERMAVVIAPEDMERFVQFASEENCETALVAKVTEKNRLVMKWRGQVIVDISRDFINSNGVEQKMDVCVEAPDAEKRFFASSVQGDTRSLTDQWLEKLADLNICSQRGLVERFDSTIGAGSVFLPYGGMTQKTPVQSMVAKLPVLKGTTTTGTAMSYGFNPYLSSWSPFHGAVYAIVDSVARIVATGGDHRRIRLSLQEYFEKPGSEPSRWGKPFAALLGAWWTQTRLGIAAIGGKDSMSGTFKDLTVPPTLVSFALAPVNTSTVISPEFKMAGSKVFAVRIPRDKDDLPDFETIDKTYSSLFSGINREKIVAAYAVGAGGIAEAITKMSFGNRIGFRFTKNNTSSWYFSPEYGTIIIECAQKTIISDIFAGKCTFVEEIGTTISEPSIIANGDKLSIEQCLERWEKPLCRVFPQAAEGIVTTQPIPLYKEKCCKHPAVKSPSPRVLITVFPGTNCEYDTARAFEHAGAAADVFVMKNITAADIEESIERVVKKINNSQIIMVPGGFSAGDEPDGSGKFINAFFRNPHITDAVHELLFKRDGLMLGICNGFQALIKLGLVPWGEIRPLKEGSPTLTFNTIGRHISRVAYTRVCSAKSPWFAGVEAGDIHAIPVSHGEGRFVASAEIIQSLIANGQVATQYVNHDGTCTGEDSNLNGS